MNLKQFRSKGGKARWKGRTKKERSAHAANMVAKRKWRPVKKKSAAS